MGGRVRVVLTVFDRVRFLREAIEGILGQSFAEFELVVVDDGSPCEEVRVVLAEFAARDARVRVLRQDNAGLAAARNAGAAFDGGHEVEYLCFADDDDVSLPARVREQFDFLETHAAFAAVVCGYVEVDAEGRAIGRRGGRGRGGGDGWGVGRCLGPGIFVRKAAFDAVGGFRAWFRVTEDADFAYRFAERFRCAVLRRELLLYRKIGVGSLTGSVRGWRFEYAAAVSAQCRALEMEDPVAVGVSLDGLMARFGDAAGFLSAPLLRKVVNRRNGAARLFIRARRGEDLLALLEAAGGVLRLDGGSRGRLVLFALGRGEWRLAWMVLGWGRGG